LFKFGKHFKLTNMIKKFTKAISLITCGLLLQGNLFAQTTIYSQNFNGTVSDWSLNTTDAGAGTNANYWIINNSYTGFSGLIPNTVNQPVGITGSPQSKYLHIVNDQFSGLGISNAVFLAPADGNVFAKMNAGVSTVGYTGVNFKFWLLCNGDALETNSYFGRTYYSIDGGTTWIQNPTTYSQIEAWTQVTVSNAAFENQADIRFAFMWVQNSANEGVATDPPFSVDDVLIEGTGGLPAVSVTTSPVAGSPFCGTKTFSLGYTSSGTFDVGNTFTVQLSDATGSFASPVTIGTGSTSPIACVIPDATVSGSGYLVRVVASAPATIGSTSALSYFVTPATTTTATPTNCGATPSGSVSVTATGGAAATAYSWSTNPVATTQTVNNLSSGTYYVTVTYGSGCTVIDSATVTATGITLASSTVLAQTNDNPPNGTISIGVAGGTAPFTYLWNTTPPSTLNTVEGLTAGDYTCSVTDNTGCTVIFTFNVPYTVGINELNLNNVEIFPNPVKDVITIKKSSSKPQNISVSINDINGKELIVENNLNSASNQNINVSALSSGVYFIQIKNNQGQLIRKFIKQ
jgi:hypothetical protein